MEQEKFNLGYQQELFNYLLDELGVIALQSQMHDIERIVLKMQPKKMYSEEDIILILSKFRELRLIDFQDWFELYKKL